MTATYWPDPGELQFVDADALDRLAGGRGRRALRST